MMKCYFCQITESGNYPRRVDCKVCEEKYQVADVITTGEPSDMFGHIYYLNWHSRWEINMNRVVIQNLSERKLIFYFPELINISNAKSKIELLNTFR